MPSYRYTARDARGAQVSGDIDATSPNEAIATLGRRGLSVTRLSAQSPQTKARNVTTVATVRSSNRELGFLFTQFGDLLNTGIAPHDAAQRLGNHARRAAMRDALRDVALQVAQGTSLADSLRRYPYLFPPSVVGMIAAGEAGGFLPDACKAVGRLRGDAHSFARSFWWAWPAVWNIVPAVPLALAIREGFMAMALAADDPSRSMAGAFFGAIGGALVGPLGLIGAVLCGLALAAQLTFAHGRVPQWSHRLAAKFGPLRARARAEASAVLTWTLSSLTRAGIPPRTAWDHAVRAVPNDWIAARLASASAGMGETTKLATLFQRAGLLDHEERAIVGIGEDTGTAPSALDQVAQANRKELERAEQNAKVRTTVWGCMLIFLGSALPSAYITRLMYDSVSRWIETW